MKKTSYPTAVLIAMKVYVNFYESMKEAVEKAVTKAPDSNIEPTQEKPQKDQPARNSEFFKVFLLFLNYCKYLFFLSCLGTEIKLKLYRARFWHSKKHFGTWVIYI